MDLEHQKNRLLKRLSEYQSKIPSRVPEYGQFKTGIVIPRIKRALEKIKEGTYGICDSCSQPISKRRLELIPAATYCRICQEHEEV